MKVPGKGTGEDRSSPPLTNLVVPSGVISFLTAACGLSDGTVGLQGINALSSVPRLPLAPHGP